MINTEKTVNDKAVSYEILEDGYEIYLDGQIWIRQRGLYSKPMDKEKSFEENCLMQIEELTAGPEPIDITQSEEYMAGYDQAVLDMMEVE